MLSVHTKGGEHKASEFFIRATFSLMYRPSHQQMHDLACSESLRI